MVFFDDAAKTSRGLVLSCVDCARFDPADPLARVLALASAAPYAMVMCAAAVRGPFYIFSSRLICSRPDLDLLDLNPNLPKSSPPP